MKNSTIIIFILMMGMVILNTPADVQNSVQSSMVIAEDGSYHLEVIAFNFDYLLIDRNKVDDLLDNGLSKDEAYNDSILPQRIANLEKGREIIITGKSNDTTHGLYINELDIDFTLEGPEVGQEYGPIEQKRTVLPSVDITINAYCNYYCGQGHSDMSFELVVGDGYDISDQKIDVIGDWRVWLLMGIFTIVTAFIVLIAVMKPKFPFTGGEEL